jgi:RNA polymerase sigma-70 factor (ECF subfamily)
VETWTDAQLTEAAAEDAQAFGELVRRHQSFVFGAALRVTRDASLAEEVTQETFFRAYRSLHTFRGDAKLRTWLYRIASNLAIDLVGRRRDTPMADVPERATERTTGAVVEIRVQSEQLRAALAELPEEMRAPLVLRVYEGLSYDEIAKRTDTPLNTVRTRIFRAKAHLREALDDWNLDG